MFFWFIYTLSSFLVSFILSTFFPTKFRFVIFCLSLALLITPENLGISSEIPSPTIFAFAFNLLLEQNVSFRTLRPLVFSLPLALAISLLFKIAKKRFSQN